MEGRESPTYDLTLLIPGKEGPDDIQHREGRDEKDDRDNGWREGGLRVSDGIIHDIDTKGEGDEPPVKLLLQNPDSNGDDTYDRLDKDGNRLEVE